VGDIAVKTTMGFLLTWMPDSRTLVAQAMWGTSGPVRVVRLPHEAHNDRGRQTVEHTLYEMSAWFDR
jgi:dipeptidyl aminopeptidase/acylaminoacyl peptidase